MIYWPVAKEIWYDLNDISTFSSGSDVVQPVKYRATWGPILWNYFDFGPVVQEITFEVNSYLELCQPLFQRNKPISAILVEGIIRNISVKLF